MDITASEVGMERLMDALNRQDRYQRALENYRKNPTPMAYMEMWAAKKALQTHGEFPPSDD